MTSDKLQVASHILPRKGRQAGEVDLYLGLGSNLGDKELNMRNAIQQIEKRIGNIVVCSAFLVTDPVGFDSDNQFLNAACLVQTTLQPLEVLHITQQIEIEMGRIAKSVNNCYADRIIDIDLLMYADAIIEHPQLTLPHPNFHTRSFVILPLAQIASGVMHPILNKTIGELKDNFLGARQGLGYPQ